MAHRYQVSFSSGYRSSAVEALVLCSPMLDGVLLGLLMAWIARRLMRRRAPPATSDVSR